MTDSQTNKLRHFFADGIRSRKEGVAPDGGAITICPGMGQFKSWARRALAMSGPLGKLPA